MTPIERKDYLDFIKQVGHGQLDDIEETYEGFPLSVKESKFINLFIANGNLKKSLNEAGLNYKNVVGKEYIINEIKHRLEQIKTNSIADAEEILQYFTSVMRGEIKDQFGLDAPLSERTRAAQELARRVIDVEVESAVPEIKVTLNWEGM